MKVYLHKDLEIFYEEYGSGPTTLLFIHGLGTTGKSWKHLVRALSSKYKCITVDLPGYGHSTQGDFPYSISFFKKSMIQLTEKLSLKNIVLVGHSMGGHIAISMALSSASLFKGLILMAPAGFETFTQEGSDLIKQWYTPDILQALTPQQVRRNFEANFFHRPPELELMIQERLDMMKTPAYQHFSNMIPQCVRGMLDEPIFDQFQFINLPVLTFFGLEDKLIPSPLLKRKTTTKEIAERGVAQFPNASLELIPNCGHFLPLDCPERIAPKCLDFLRNI